MPEQRTRYGHVECFGGIMGCGHPQDGDSQIPIMEGFPIFAVWQVMAEEDVNL